MSNGKSDEASPSLVLSEISPRKRNPPRMNPVKSAAKMVAKHPDLVGRITPDGIIEIASKASSATMSNETQLDASTGDDVWNAIAAIRNASRGTN